MSRIGNRVLSIPAGVEVTVDGLAVTIKGPKGELSYTFNPEVTISVEDNQLTVARNSEAKRAKQLHGTTNALIKNMIVGVTEGYTKGLEINGVGYRAQLSGNKLTLNMGYSHPVIMEVPAGLTVEVPKNTEISVSGIDKQLVGEFAANIRSVRAPEPYKGKGIRYKGEHVRRKEGKTAK
jgi:large subunit ribosomal protein L6